MKTRLFLILSSLALSAVDVRAQMPATTFRPALVESFAASYSYSGKSGFRNDDVYGGTSVQHADASVAGRVTLGSTTFLNLGAAVSINSFDSDSTVPLPEKLGELTLNAGVTQVFSQQWRASFFARPGYYGDFEHYTARTLNVPAIAVAAYEPSREFLWMFGVSVNAFAQYPVMPVVSMRWAFAENWVLNLGFPRLGVTWQATKALELGINGTAQGGGYRTTKAPGDPARAELANTYVNYRELRVGARGAYQLGARARFALEAGWMADRRFEYYDRDFTLKGKPSAYFTASVDVRM